MTPTPLRTLLLDTVIRVLDQGELADRALDRALRAHRNLHSRERRLLGEALFAVVRHHRRLDYQLEQAAALGWRNLSTPDRHLWRVTAALLFACAKSEADAARVTGLERGDVAKIAAAIGIEPSWPADPAVALGTRRSVPDHLAARFLAQFSDDADRCLESLGERAPLTLRANTLKGDREALLTALRAEGVEATAGALSPWAVTLQERPNVFGLESYKRGLFEVQDEGSQLIALATAARSGRCVVDACAGGGGKTLALSATMHNKGRLIACDVNQGRMSDIPVRARRAGAFNIEPLVVPVDRSGDTVLNKIKGKADVVLVDAPCSGTGSWRRNPDARWRLTAEQLAAFPAVQLSILRRHASLVRPGGAIVYATCSLFREENEDVVEAFLAGGEFELEVAPVPQEARDGGFLKLLPHVHGTDGFFAAVMRRPK